MLTALRGQRGFSLVELMVTVAVLAVLMTLVAPLGLDWIANSRIRTASESMLAGLQLARAEAVRRNTPVAFVLESGSGAGWTVQMARSGEEIQARSGGEGTAQVAVTVTPASADRISFDGLGRRTANADASAPIETISLDSTTLPAASSRDLRLQLGLGGQITLCDPNVTATNDSRKCP